MDANSGMALLPQAANSQCSAMVMEAEAELGAFTSAVSQMFGIVVAGYAAECWVEVLESKPKQQPLHWRGVTIAAASLVADCLDAMRGGDAEPTPNGPPSA